MNLTSRRLMPALQPRSAPAASAVLRRKCACGRHTIAGGECGECKRKREASAHGRVAGGPGAGPRAKLRLGSPDERYEREADRVAEAVTAGLSAAVAPGRVAMLQRSEDDGASDADLEAVLDTEAEQEPDDEEVPEEVEESDGAGGDASGQPKLERAADPRRASAPFSVPRGAGRPLDAPVRQFMEERIGHPFANVRVHADAEAAASARRVNARAYTLGSHVYFAEGEYRPADRDGRKLLAHELAHVVQQAGGGAGGILQQKPAEASKGKTKTKGKTKVKSKAKAKAKKPKDCSEEKCDGKCAPPTAKAAHHPWCRNETCAGSGAAASSKFIHYADVNLTTQDLTLHWGDGKTTVKEESMLSSPSPGDTPTGLTKAGIKCGPCHTNKKKPPAGMGWFTSFREQYRFGFHNSQKVARGVRSHGCVRIVDCATAERIQKNMASGVTDVCVHKGNGCKDKPPPPLKPKGGGGGSSPSPERAGPAVGAADASSEGAPG